MRATDSPPSTRWRDAPDHDAKSAIFLAIRNAFALGGSLLGTWSIALAIRLVLPRFLGPSLFGTLTFADAFTATFFVTLNLGLDYYIHKEVSVRPAHASDFLGGALVLRLVMTVGLFGLMTGVLRLAGRPANVIALVYLYGCFQFFVLANGTLSSLLHAKGRVRGVSILAVVSKVMWAAGVVAAMVLHAPLWAYGIAYVASEGTEVVALWWLARKHLGVVFRIDVSATRAMLLASLPYYLNGLLSTAYGKLDITILDFYDGNEEVGLYGAAQAVAGLTLLATPVMSWVLMPMFARAAARSHEELYSQARRSLELILSIVIPVSLIINLGADMWIRLIFGAAYAPAASALRVLACMFVVMYVSMVFGMTQVMLERAWALVSIFLLGLIVNLVLNLVLIRFSLHWFGPGGGGTGCALATLATETTIASCMAYVTRLRTFNRRNVSVIARSVAACAVVVVVHRLLPVAGVVRIAIDASIYFILVVVTGALRPKEMLNVVREAMSARNAGRS